VPAVAIHIAILAAKFAALMASRSVIPVSQVAAQFAAIMCDLVLILPDVSVQAVIVSKSRRYTHPNQQQNSSNCAFHFSSDPHSMGTGEWNTELVSKVASSNFFGVKEKDYV
jgi:hypothetical protein